MFSRGKNPCTVTGPGLPGKGIMNESRKMINWMAGVTTFVVALLIVIVLLDTEQDGVSLATASRSVALTLESESGILEYAPEISNFDEILSDQWFVKYMAPITAMVIAIIAIAAAIVWNQALGGYDLAHAINRKENKKNNKIIQLQLNKMLDDENYTGLYLLDRDAERTLDSSERYGWSDFYNMAYYYRDLRVSICSLYDPGQENSYYTETALSNASRAIRNAEDIINNTSRYRNRAEESVPYIDDITDKIYMFLKAYCNFTDDDIAGLPEKSQTDIITLLSRRMFDDEQKN